MFEYQEDMDESHLGSCLDSVGNISVNPARLSSLCNRTAQSIFGLAALWDLRLVLVHHTALHMRVWNDVAHLSKGWLLFCSFSCEMIVPAPMRLMSRRTFWVRGHIDQAIIAVVWAFLIVAFASICADLLHAY